jgi:surface antigen/predicted  nucleic acid-binding Zn-ribbon protein
MHIFSKEETKKNIFHCHSRGGGNLYKRLLTKLGIFACLVLFFIGTMPVYALTQQEAQNQINQINQQIANINKSLNDNQNQQYTLKGEIATINAHIQEIQLQVNATQYQVDILNNQITETNNQITRSETDLATQKNILSEYLKTMYIEGQTSTIELIARSKNFSDFVDRSEYLGTMQQNVQETANKIVTLRKELEQKKKSLEVNKAKAEQVKASQVAQQAAIISQQNYKNGLLANTGAAEASLSKQKNDLYARKAQLSASFGETISGGSSGYPYGNPPATNIIDTPDAYGYLIGECTSYAAWWRAFHSRPIPRNLGNANTWGTRAKSQGYSVDNIPTKGSVMVFPYIGGYGHVAIVEVVYGDGTVGISEYNWTPYRYGERGIIGVHVNPYNYGAVFIH